MKLSAILAPMIAAGVPGEVILATVKAFEEQQIDALEKRRASDRERQSKRRHVMSRDVTVTASSHASVARGEDNLLPKKIAGQEERKKEAPQATPRRATRLRHDWILPMEWYREAEAAGLSHDQIGSEAKAMLNWSLSDRNGAKLDWQATWRNWFARAARPRGQAPPGKRTISDVISDRLDEANGQQGIFGDRGNVERLPTRLIESRPDHENLRGGLAGRIVRIDR